MTIPCLIEGLYTIGSVGTVSQTPGSDCDIWVCIDKKGFTQKAWQQINQKLNLIKDWMDAHLVAPVYFFISDVHEIRMNRFGRVDAESSGSAQQNTLKEEFYRTCISICGKIPLWWLCFDREAACGLCPGCGNCRWQGPTASVSMTTSSIWGI